MLKALSLLFLLVLSLAASGQERTVLLDFTNGRLNGYGGQRTESLTPTPEGLHVVTTGKLDPWIEGPPLKQLSPGNSQKIVLEIRFKGTGAKKP